MDTEGEQMKYTNKYNLPVSLYEAIKNDSYDAPKNEQNVISATGLISTPRERQLYIRHHSKITEDISDNIWRLFGTGVHTQLERIQHKDIDSNPKRVVKEINGMNVTGKCDVISDEGIDDFKVTSVWTVLFNSSLDSWTKQLNIYSWLYDIRKKLRVIAIMRDWQTSKAKFDNSGNYPKIPIAIVPIKLWTPEEQLKYVKERLQLHTEVVSMSDEELPLCSPEERWRNDTTYAIMKKGAKKALKVCNTLPEAEKYLSCYKDPSVCEVILREGEDKKCVGYCGVCKFCDYWVKKYAKGNEVF